MKYLFSLLLLSILILPAEAKFHRGVLAGVVVGAVNDAKTASFPVRHPKQSGKAVGKATAKTVRALAGL